MFQLSEPGSIKASGSEPLSRKPNFIARFSIGKSISVSLTRNLKVRSYLSRSMASCMICCRYLTNNPTCVYSSCESDGGVAFAENVPRIAAIGLLMETELKL